MSCCTNTYDLGCHNYCSVVTFPVVSNITDSLKVVYEFANQKQKNIFDALQGEPIYLYLNTLNESAEYIFSIYDSDGDKLSFEIDGTQYDCFEIKTEIWRSSTNGDFNDDFNNDFNNQ